jgi:MoxR-like ATPase
MCSRRDILALAAIGVAVSAPPPAWAQRGRGGAVRTAPPRTSHIEKEQRTPIEEFETLSHEEQRKALNRLSPSEREKLQERLKRFNALPPEQQQALKTLYNRLHQLPPDRQDAVRKAIVKFSEQTPARQEAIRQELRDMASLTAAERKARLASPEFRSQFNKKEQEILRDMSPLLPDRQ